MSQPSQVRTYVPTESAVFLKTNERFGGLSNMAPGFPLVVNGVRIRTSEALYQSCRFPHMPEVQRMIIGERSPMTAKMRSKPYHRASRPDWDGVRVKIMRWCLRVKLAQNWATFGRLLLSTGDRPIVEKKVRRKDFWGATEQPDGTLVGMNVLGRLLMELREQLKGDEAENLRFIEPLAISEFLLFGQPIEAVQAAPNAEIPGWTPRRPSQADTVPPRPRDPQPSLFEQPMISNAEPASVPSRPTLAREDESPKQMSDDRSSVHDWLGDLPRRWDVLRSKYLFREIDDRTDTGTETLLSMRQAHGLIPHAKVSTKPVTPEELKGYKRVRTGQMVLNRMQASNGMFAVAREDGLVSPDYAVFQPLRPMEPDYFVDLFKTTIYRAKFRQESKGLGTGMSGFLRLYSDRFGAIHVPQPPEDEQRKIVQFIRSYDHRVRRLIRSKRRLIELLNEQKQAIINQAVTRGLNPDAPMKSTGIAWMPEVPAHWEVIPLRHLSTCLDGRRVPLEASAREKMLGDIPYWGANQIIDHLNDFLFDEDLILLGEDGAPFFDRNKPVAFFSQGKVWPNNHIHVLRPKPGNRSEFIVHALNCADYTNYVGGATRDKLTQSYMKAIPIPVPPKDEQDVILDRLAQECTPLETTAERAAREIGFIQEYRERLIADVVTGKLDVRHIEIAAPADEPTTDDDDAMEEGLEDNDAEVMEGADADD